MAIEVVIRNNKKMFKQRPQLTKNNIMNNFPNNIQLGYSLSLNSRWKPLTDDINNISDKSVILLDQNSYGRGIDVYVAEDMSYIKCSLLVPTVKCELELFEIVVKKLAKFMNTKYVEVEGNPVPIKKNVLSADLVDFALYRSFTSFAKREKEVTLPCSFYPLTLDTDLVKRLSQIDSHEFQIEFDDYLRQMLTVDVFYADAALFENSNQQDSEKFIAVYSIVDDCETVIPTFNRYPDAKSYVSGSIYPNPSLPDGDNLGEIEYDKFLEEAIKFKVRTFDPKHIVINLKEEDIREIWGKNEIINI